MKFSKGFVAPNDAALFHGHVAAGNSFQAAEFVRANCVGRVPVGWWSHCLACKDDDLLDDYLLGAKNSEDFSEEDYGLDEVRALVERRDVPLHHNQDLDDGFWRVSWFLRNQLVEERPAQDYLTVEGEYQHVHAGNEPRADQISTGKQIEIRTGRDFATYVHKDHPLRQWSIVIDDLIRQKVPVNLPGADDFTKLVFLNGLVGEVLARAWVLSFYLKWLHVLLRAEELAHKQGKLLPQAYAEGCPLHPTRPGMHPFMSRAAEAALLEVVGYSYVLPTERTVAHELDLYCANIDFGRLWAGVHVRKDGETCRPLAANLGQRVAREHIQRSQ